MPWWALTNELQGYYYCHLDTNAPAMEQARELRNGYEQIWQSITKAGYAAATGLDTAAQAASDGAAAVGSWLNPFD